MPLTLAIQRAKELSPWRIGNNTLYKLCETRPTHTDEADIIAKIWLIGRSYAAAIERRKNKGTNKLDKNDDFYLSLVAPKIKESQIDTWINQAKRYKKPNADSYSTLLYAHYETTQLFKKISGFNNRSLASKYLHFHVPELFYIYDSRAVNALRQFSNATNRTNSPLPLTNSDNEYRKFAEKCLALQQHIEEKYHVNLTPREIDNLLLQAHENQA